MCGSRLTDPGTTRIVSTLGRFELASDSEPFKGETQDRKQENARAFADQAKHGHPGIRSAEPGWTAAPPHELAHRWPGSRQDRVCAAMSGQRRETASSGRNG